MAKKRKIKANKTTAIEPKTLSDMHMADVIRKHTDTEQKLLACAKVGEDDDTEYILVLREKTHEGRQFLDLRYFQISPTLTTWMKNGITLRDSKEMRKCLKDLIGKL